VMRMVLPVVFMAIVWSYSNYDSSEEFVGKLRLGEFSK
jgi:hypothetical protein